MTRDLRMLLFHLRQFGTNSYFAQLLLTSTLSIHALQALGVAASGGSGDLVWLRSGMVGLWSVTVVSAGMIGYQRFQGTLTYLVASPLGVGRTLLPVVGAASTFGILAFPLAIAAAVATGLPVHVLSPVSAAAAIAVFWVACAALSCVVAVVFVLTPNAITYEGLLAVPLILLSGVFGTPAALAGVLAPLDVVLPTRLAVRALVELGESPGGPWGLLAGSLAVSGCWFAVAIVLVQRASRKALVDGTLEMV